VTLDRVVAKFDAQQAKNQANAAWLVEEQRILEELALPVWRAVRTALEAKCGRFPRHFVFEVQPDTEALIRSGKSRRFLTVEYLSAAKAISYQCGNTSGYISIRIDEDREAALCDHGVFKSPEDLTEELIALILS
jgi:hypothetical protein